MKKIFLTFFLTFFFLMPVYSVTMKDYNKIISINTNDVALVLNERGVAKISTGDYAGAIEDFSIVISLYPNAATAYSNRAFAKVMSGKNTSAIQDSTIAISLNPNDAQAYLARGIAKYKLDNKVGGIEDITKARNLYLIQQDYQKYKVTIDFLNKLK